MNLAVICEDYREFFKKWFEVSDSNIIVRNYSPLRVDLITASLVRFEKEANAEMLTLVAFELLKQPIHAPSLFISYRRQFSSTFALAIEARLRSVGHHNIFIDKDIEPGDDWLEVLKDQIAHCDYFVFITDQEVFESKWMREEYTLASEMGKKIIPIIHPEVDISKFDDDFKATQFIECRGNKSAASYEDAINRLLSRLGYATY